MRVCSIGNICLLVSLFTFSSCDRDNTVSSSRSLERLVVGTWMLPDPFNSVFQGLEGWRHIIFKPDGAFVAPGGIAGARLPEYKGNYWVVGNYLGAKGVGGALGTGNSVGEGRVHVQFARLDMQEGQSTEALGLTITEILPEHIITLGNSSPDEMSSGDIQDILRKFNETPPPMDVFGEVRSYQKISRL